MRVLALLLGLSLAVSGCHHASEASTTEVTIAAAASMRLAMPDLMGAFSKDHEGVRLTVSYGASGDLRQQVEGGAPIDVVVFASPKPVDDLIKARLVDAATRTVIATNSLVLVGPRGGKPYTFLSIETVPVSEKIAIGDPKSVPAGQYAKAALEKLGKWDAVEGHVVFGGDVTAVLAYARRGEVSAAVVYKTDVHGIADVVVLDELRGDVAPRIEDVAGVTTATKSAGEAKAFVQFLGSAAGRKILDAYGFGGA